MKILEISDYPNFLDHETLESKDVCNIIKKYSLSFPQTRNKQVEWGIEFPMFLTPFYKYIYQQKNILTQDGFFEYYYSENSEYFKKSNFSSEIIEGLKARVYRTYPSLVRDLHFSLFVKENLKEVKAVYNRKLDIEEGIDLLLIKNDVLYGINLYTDTRRAHYGREKKVFRHTKFDNVNYIELPVEFKGSVECGAFFLYGEKELNKIIKELNL